MPTGYTADLMEKGMEFKPFVLQCARAFGALITMRDDSLDAPIPEKFEPDDYHIKKLAEAIQEQKRLQSMTDDEKVSFGIQAREENIVSHQKSLATAIAENERLIEMTHQVKAWKPPTPDHDELKKFMLEQINISMHDLSYSYQYLKEAEERSPMPYYVAAVSSAARDINYHTKEHQKECERVENRTEWVKQLRMSL